MSLETATTTSRNEREFWPRLAPCKRPRAPTLKLEATQLKGGEAVAELDNVHQRGQLQPTAQGMPVRVLLAKKAGRDTATATAGYLLGDEDKDVAGLDHAPAAQKDVVVQAPRDGELQVLVKDRVRIVDGRGCIDHSERKKAS